MKEMHCMAETQRTLLISNRFRARRQPQIVTMKILTTVLHIRGVTWTCITAWKM